MVIQILIGVYHHLLNRFMLACPLHTFFVGILLALKTMSQHKTTIQTTTQGYLLAGMLAVLCHTTPIFAATTVDIEATERLLQIAEKFLQRELGKEYELHIKFGYLDHRLRLPKCDKIPEAYLPDPNTRYGSTLVGLRCGSNVSWKIVIPVYVRAFANVVITRQAFAKDTQLHSNDLSLSRQELSSMHAGAFNSMTEIDGMVLRRAVTKDTILTPSMLQPKRLVQRGASVTIEAQYQGVMIRVQGIALMDGHQGQMIRVQNARSGREVDAEVVASATVKVKI